MIVELKLAPDPDVVRDLEELLAMAHSGELRSFSLVGDLSEGRANFVNSGKTQNVFAKVGRLQYMLHTLCNEIDEA